MTHFSATGDEYNRCLATTPLGVAFRGALRQSILGPDVEFCSFLGLRYAKSSLGDRRYGVSLSNFTLECTRIDNDGRGEFLTFQIFTEANSSRTLRTRHIRRDLGQREMPANFERIYRRRRGLSVPQCIHTKGNNLAAFQSDLDSSCH